MRSFARPAAALALLASLPAVTVFAEAPRKTTVSEQRWGTLADGQPAQLFTLSDGQLKVTLTNYGAHVVSIFAPDRNGKMADVVLGYDKLSDYEADHDTYFGAIVGRYGNRLANGRFPLDGKTYQVPPNDHGNALHGGTVGFDQKLWTARQVSGGVEMTLVSPDGDMGFPGQLTVHVAYTLAGNALRIVYTATTTQPTVVNVTNHSYFNLSGGDGTVLHDELTLAADRYTPVKTGLIPTGELAPVAGTPFDFRTPHTIGERIHQQNAQLELAGGYDHNFVLNAGMTAQLHPAALVFDPASGRTLTVTTTEPGVQFYSGNFLKGAHTGHGGIAYPKYGGLALETQHFPDSPNQPSFPSTVLRPGQTLHSETVFTLGVRH